MYLYLQFFIKVSTCDLFSRSLTPLLLGNIASLTTIRCGDKTIEKYVAKYLIKRAKV